MIELTPDQQQFIEAEVAAGGFRDANAVVQAAVELYRRAKSPSVDDDFDDTVRDIQATVADVEAGLVRPFAEADAEIRAKHGFRNRG